MNFRPDPGEDFALEAEGGLINLFPMGNKSRVVWKVGRNRVRITRIQLNFLSVNNQEKRLSRNNQRCFTSSVCPDLKIG